jgi:hypothetical protein
MFNMQGDIAGRNFEQIMNKIKPSERNCERNGRMRFEVNS